MTLFSQPAGKLCRKGLGRLDRIRNWPERMLKAKYDFGALVADCCISRRQMLRFTREEYGVSARQFLNEYRLRQGLLWLLEGKSVKETAHDLHYPYASAFSREFKRFYEESPTQFLRSVTQNVSGWYEMSAIDMSSACSVPGQCGLMDTVQSNEPL